MFRRTGQHRNEPCVEFLIVAGRPSDPPCRAVPGFARVRRSGARMSEKTFILGLGAQKAGTSWLHAYLSAAPDADMGFTKEYHVWDFRSPLSAAVRLRLTPALLLHRSRLRIACFQRWPSLYFRYFQGLLKHGKTLTGDITPSYSCLAPDDLRGIAARFAKLDIRVKVVFLMRDPVDRCWSAARMKSRRLERAGSHRAAESILRDHFRSGNYRFRTRYQDVLATIAASGIPPADVYHGFYEEMFSAAEIRRLSRFLGVRADPSFGERQIFSAASRESPPPDVARDVARFYAETYDAVAAFFPRARSLWPGFRLLESRNPEAEHRRAA